jgi:integrase
MTTALARHNTNTELSTGLIPAGLLAGRVDAKTAAKYWTYFRTYCAYAGSEAAALQPETFAKWQQELFVAGYSNKKGESKPYAVRTMNLMLSGVRKIMKAAAQQGYIPHETAEAFKHVEGFTMKANKERRREHARTRIERDAMDLICAAPGLYTKGKGARLMHTALLLTLRYTGARISEVAGMQQADIVPVMRLEPVIDDNGNERRDAKGKAIQKQVQHWTASFMGKNENEPVQVELGTPAKAAIDEWLDYRRTVLGIDVAAIFTGFTGRGDRNPGTEAISRVSAWHIVQRYTRLLGMEHIKPHDFRRYVGTGLAAKDIRLAQKQLRHKRIETTAQHYVLDNVQLGHMDSL